jgi:hypothetical protein
VDKSNFSAVTSVNASGRNFGFLIIFDSETLGILEDQPTGATGSLLLCRLWSFSKMGRSARIRGMVAAAVNAAATIPTVRLE